MRLGLLQQRDTMALMKILAYFGPQITYGTLQYLATFYFLLIVFDTLLSNIYLTYYIKTIQV